MELNGRDTLESVQFCHKLIQRRGDCERIVCCTSRYHQPRCALLLMLLGYTVVLPKIRMTRGRLSSFELVRLFVRELVALPYDSFLLFVAKRHLTRQRSLTKVSFSAAHPPKAYGAHPAS